VAKVGTDAERLGRVPGVFIGTRLPVANVTARYWFEQAVRRNALLFLTVGKAQRQGQR